MKYYVDTQGNYLGGFQGAMPPEGSTEVPIAPSDARDKWFNNNWVAYVAPKVFKPLSAKQVRLVLSEFMLRDSVETAIAQSSQSIKDEWNFSNDFEINHPVLVGMATALGLSREQLETMFERGAQL